MIDIVPRPERSSLNKTAEILCKPKKKEIRIDRTSDVNAIFKAYMKSAEVVLSTTANVEFMYNKFSTSYQQV